MGNIYALTQKKTDYPSLPSLPPIDYEKPESTGEDLGLIPKKIENPGTFKKLHKKCHDIYPDFFEGARFLFRRGLSKHFEVSHGITMSSVTPAGYRFGSTYIGTKQFGPNEAYPALYGDMDLNGNLNAAILHRFGKSIYIKLKSQVQGGEYIIAQATGNYRGDDFSTSVTVSNLDIINNNGIITAHYLQSITARLALGAELAYRHGFLYPGSHSGILSLGARYTGYEYICSSTIGNSGVHLACYQKSSKQLHFAIELESNFKIMESVLTMGYHVDIPKANLSIKGFCNSNGYVGATVNKKLESLPFLFEISALIYHPKNDFKCGIGLIADL